MRNKLSGSAVTPSEEAFLEPLIPKLGDSPENFIQKLEQLRQNPLDQLNSVRGSVFLKDLDEGTLLDKAQRVSLYQDGVQEVPQVQAQPSFTTSTGFTFTPSKISALPSEDEQELNDIFNQE